MKEKEWEEEEGTAIQLSPILEPLSDCEVAREYQRGSSDANENASGEGEGKELSGEARQ